MGRQDVSLSKMGAGPCVFRLAGAQCCQTRINPHPRDAKQHDSTVVKAWSSHSCITSKDRTVVGDAAEAQEAEHGTAEGAHAPRTEQEDVGVPLTRVVHNVPARVVGAAHARDERRKLDVLDLHSR